MILSPHVKMSDGIKEREAEVRKAIQDGTECPFLYCITLPSNEKNLLDIHPYRELRKRKEYEKPFVILGLTKNRREAVWMVEEMVAEVAKASVGKPEEFKKIFLEYRDSLVEEMEQFGKE